MHSSTRSALRKSDFLPVDFALKAPLLSTPLARFIQLSTSRDAAPRNPDNT